VIEKLARLGGRVDRNGDGVVSDVALDDV